MKYVILFNGECVFVFGMGIWNMGDNCVMCVEEIVMLCLGFDLGLCLIDIVEMYGEGFFELLIGEVIVGWCDEVFFVSKVYLYNVSWCGIVVVCECSLCCFGIDCFDLYLLYWCGDVLFEEILEGLKVLQCEGKICQYGVSNFDLFDMEEWWDMFGGDQIVVNQLFYNFSWCGIEWDLLFWLCECCVLVMVYLFIEQVWFVWYLKLVYFVQVCGMMLVQVVFVWLLVCDGIIVIFKIGYCDWLCENIGVLLYMFMVEQFVILDSIFLLFKGLCVLEMF